MNQKLSAIVQAFAPPIVWNAYLRLRRRRRTGLVWREFGNVITCSHSKPILEGQFAELYERYYKLDPFIPKEVWRYRLYNVAVFADFCRDIPGDFVCAGVSWGLHCV